MSRSLMILIYVGSLAAGLSGLATGLTGEARSAPPANADPALAPWYNSLRQPHSNASCCKLADCRTTEFRIDGDHYQAQVDGVWKDVPPETVLTHSGNPTGQAVVCSLRGLILCFVKGTET